jgi:hypothetical protein
VPEFNGTMAYVWAHPELRRCGAWDDPRPAPAKTTCLVADINMDMVGEDTVKTNGRFYFTRAPDSVPSFMTTFLTDVLEQTREAELFAPTGTHNYWNPEVIPYMQGSDHDVFLGLGVPSSMLGHDPDWTHHTSEDTVDKTDASELLRVGVFAAASAYWMASAGDPEWKSLGVLADADHAAEATRRAARRQVFAKETGAPPSSSASPRGPRRLTTLPFEDVASELKPDDERWLLEQAERQQKSGGPGLGMLIFEVVNFMDGRRSTAEIARLVSDEFLIPIDTALVDRLVAILASKGIVTR